MRTKARREDRRGSLRLLLLAGATLALALGAAGSASAATGELTPRGCIADVGDFAGCGTTQQGLSRALGVAVSPDGSSVYVVSAIDGAIVRFDRNPATGALTPRGCIADAGDIAGCGTTQQGLNAASGVAVSPDGSSVYVASSTDDAIVRFDRNPATGALSGQGCIADVGDTAGCGTTQQGLNGASGVAVSPDGSSVYVASFTEDAIVSFDRNPATGALTPRGCIADAGDFAGCGTTQQGLNAAYGVAVSPDGSSVYVASSNDAAIVSFDRNPATGALSGQGCIADAGDTAGCGTTQQGLNGARGVAVSPDGSSVYVASSTDDAIVSFDRNPATGALSGQGCIADAGDTAGCGTTQQGLNTAYGVAVSPDGSSVYVVSAIDGAIVRFDRNPATGALTPRGCIADVGDTAGCGTTQQGLNTASDVAVSPDGSSVYVASLVDDAIVRFDRETPPPPTPPPPTPPPPTPPDTTVEGSASAKKKQKQKGKKIAVKAKAKAGEDLSAKGRGEVKVKKKTYELKPVTKSVSSGSSKNLKLKPKKSKDAKKIAKALKKGKKAKAKLTVKLTDEVGNKKSQKLKVKLKR